MVGQGVALLTFTGRKTGKTYIIPVSYHRDDDTVTVVTKRARRWWRNFETAHEVEVRIAGRNYTGKAEAATGEAEALEFMVDYLEKRPIDAKAYGLARNEITRKKVARIVPHIVLIRIAISPVE
jgi:deazaflavin-dependent oxidoreductase (nitroreductase family)